MCGARGGHPFVICVAVTPNMAPMTISSRLMKRVDSSAVAGAAVLSAPYMRSAMTIMFSASVASILAISMPQLDCGTSSFRSSSYFAASSDVMTTLI